MSTHASISTLRSAARPARTRALSLDGERLAVGTTALAVVGLPLLAPHGPGNTGPADVLIVLSIAAALLWVGRSGHRLRFAYGIPMALFIAGGALGALVGPVPGIGTLSLVQDIMLVAWCWTFMNVASTPSRLKTLLAAWAYSAIVWAVLLFVGLGAGITFLSGQSAREGSRTALTFGDPNVSANYYVISIMIICATGVPRRRAWRIAAYALLVAAVLSTGSNSGMVSLVVATAVATVLAIRQRVGTAAAVCAFALLLAGGLLLKTTVSLKPIQQKAYASHYAFIRDGLGRGEVSVDQRSMLLHEGIGLYMSGGFLGQGPVSTKPRLTAEMAPFVKEAHNDYLAALTERGVLGTLGLIMLMAGLVMRASVIARRRMSSAFASVVARPNAIIGALAGTMVTETVYELLHVRHVWALFALVAALYVWGGKDAPAA
jgi:O-antigen ligase